MIGVNLAVVGIVVAPIGPPSPLPTVVGERTGFHTPILARRHIRTAAAPDR